MRLLLDFRNISSDDSATDSGKFYTCLFAESGTDLKGPMRSGDTDEELLERLRTIWAGRSDRYSELRATIPPNKRPLRKVEMYQIGG